MDHARRVYEIERLAGDLAKQDGHREFYAIPFGNRQEYRREAGLLVDREREQS